MLIAQYNSKNRKMIRNIINKKIFTIVGENTYPVQIGRGLESKLIHGAPSARFKTKATRQKEESEKLSAATGMEYWEILP